VHFGIDCKSIGNDQVETYYTDKISSPCLLYLIGVKIDIYIPRLSNCGIHAISILTKYLTNYSVNPFPVRTLGDPKNFLPYLLALMVNLEPWAPVIPDGGRRGQVSAHLFIR